MVHTGVRISEVSTLNQFCMFLHVGIYQNSFKFLCNIKMERRFLNT